MKNVFFGLTLALATAISNGIPSLALNEFHPTAIPTTCIGCDSGTASAKWVNDPNHFHLDLLLQASGCPGQVVVLNGVSPDTPPAPGGPNFAGALVKPATAHKATSFAFDFKSNICHRPFSGFLVAVVGSDSGVYGFLCDSFPTPATNTWQHENITRADLGMADGVTMESMYIGVFSNSNANDDFIQARVRNITVDGTASIDVTEPAQTFCPKLPAVAI